MKYSPRFGLFDCPGSSSNGLLLLQESTHVSHNVGRHMTDYRNRLLPALASLYPHLTGPAKARNWYRSHVGSFDDQVYPIQALARLHASARDPEALAVADWVAGRI